MEPVIKLLTEKKLVGIRLRMSLADNQTPILWQRFMPQRKEILNALSHDLFSMQVYDGILDTKNFNPHAPFDKWAAVEVTDFNAAPDGMETFLLPGGLYAVFHYKGLSTDPTIFQYIYGVWLSGSNYALDNRPHFEVLGEKYKNNHPDSEEEIWIPIQTK